VNSHTPERGADIDRAFQASRWADVASATFNLLDKVRSGAADLEATAHPLGFIHAALCERKDGSRLRLHLWPAEPFEPQSPAWVVHRHAWPLRSFVIQGQIRDRRFRILPTPQGSQQLYEAAYREDQSVLVPTADFVDCEPGQDSVEDEGSVYIVPSKAFHASEALVPSVTVAESGISVGISPAVVGELGEKEVVYRRRRLTPIELRGQIEHITS
jgi:hypothetical protein